MMTYKKARLFQFVILLILITLLGIGVYFYINHNVDKGEVEGEKDTVYKEDSVTELNVTPVFKSDPPINAFVGEEYSYFISISDSDTALNDLELTLLEGPKWMEIDGFEVHGIPSSGTFGEGMRVVLNISDGVNSSNQIYYLNITNRDEETF